MRRTKTVPMIAVSLLITLSFSGSSLAQFETLRRLTGSGSDSSKKQIAHFKIKGRVAETPTRMPPLFGGERPVSMESLLARFRKARQDPNVVAVVVDLQNAAFGAAQLEEIHAALRKFDAVDKDVYLHADSLNMLTYAAATAASHISVVPTGDLWILGLYGETPYLRGLLDKIGVEPDFLQFEDFKTATELITRTGPSDQSREMTDWLLDGIYGTIVDLIADGRK
ncbi:MAG: S49 family peptidase, partial [Planctomycetes bacterium]|nr:S49 family peptidase [Planctomycetota bacterium]